jgi:hypothetical protein
MAGSANQWARCVLRWAFYIYVVGLTAASLPPVRAVWDDILQPPNAQLLIVTAVPLYDVTVIYDGRIIKQRPGSFIRDVVDYGKKPVTVYSF